MNIDWNMGFTGLILGLGTVFVVLILLILFITIMGKIAQNLGKKESKLSAKQKPAVEKKVEPENDEDEIIAAIIAAIACIEQKEGRKFKIRSYRQV